MQNLIEKFEREPQPTVGPKSYPKDVMPPPSPDAFAALHTVELERDGHTELKGFGAYMPNPHHPNRKGHPVRPGDPIEYNGTIPLHTGLLKKAGADPRRCCIMKTLEGSPVPLEPGTKGVYEFVGDGRVRFLGAVSDFQKGMPPELNE